KIFVPFSRLSNGTDTDGNGLGLANCKRIVELHGGKIWLESKGNQGSTFLFTLKKSVENQN
uniref:ATP-binding protein n=1 Tax=Flexithrix dorotheae TaxID=70993 RepID=UPI00037041E9